MTTRIGSLEFDVPVIAAPMAGGPTTPRLVEAVGEAGGIGTLAAGYLTAEALRPLLTEVESLTSRAYGVNLFLPGPDRGNDEDLSRWRTRLAPVAQRLSAASGTSVAVGDGVWFDEDVDAKLAVLAEFRPAFVSVTFADPGREIVDRVHDEIGALALVTVTSAAEARAAQSSGADAVVAQGIEAGGHRGIWRDDPADPLGAPATATVDLVREVCAAIEVPLIAAGGVVDVDGTRAMLDAGAVAVQAGTAFLAADEAGTSAPHRRAVTSDRGGRGTVITRAFSGRPARALANAFTDEFTADAPAIYPHLHYMSKPLRAAATALGDAESINLWAGTGWPSIIGGPASEIVARLAGSAAR